MEEKLKNQGLSEELKKDLQKPAADEELGKVAGGRFRGCNEHGVGYLPGKPALVVKLGGDGK